MVKKVFFCAEMMKFTEPVSSLRSSKVQKSNGRHLTVAAAEDEFPEPS